MVRMAARGLGIGRLARIPALVVSQEPSPATLLRLESQVWPTRPLDFMQIQATLPPLQLFQDLFPNLWPLVIPSASNGPQTGIPM